MTKKDFREATKLNKIYNKIITFEKYNIGTVMWHTDREWKLIKDGAIFKDILERDYIPIAQFHTQEQLWQYIKLLNK